MTRGRRLLWWLGVFIVVLLALTVLARFLEPRLTFYPSRGEDRTPAFYRVPFTPYDVTTTDGERLRVWHLPGSNARARVVYFHGNGGNLSVWCDILVELPRRGFDVVAFDYRGYGLSSGQPTEQGLYRDAEAVLALAHDRLRRSDLPLLYWGRSLGAAVAAYAASRREPDGLILESGFPSLRAVAEGNPLLWLLSWFATYEFPAARWAATTRTPILVMHGDADSVIPYALGERLAATLPGTTQFVTIQGGDHNDLQPSDPDAYWRAVNAFVDRAGRP